MNFSKIDPCDCVNGQGIRTTLFVSGCDLRCPQCFNKEAQNFKAGNLFTPEDFQFLMGSVANPHCAGLSVLGGEPMHEKNLPAVAEIIGKVREQFGHTKNIWLWSGYTLEELRERYDILTDYVLANIDVLVDGRFVQELKDPTLKFRGSSNQRILKRGIDF